MQIHPHRVSAVAIEHSLLAGLPLHLDDFTCLIDPIRACPVLDDTNGYCAPDGGTRALNDVLLFKHRQGIF
jgi:hypothetical protein